MKRSRISGLMLIISVVIVLSGCKKGEVIKIEKFVYEAGNPDEIEIPEAEPVLIDGLILNVNHIERPTQPISYAFDRDLGTKYHSPWSTDIPPTVFPVIITATLPDDAPAFDYMLYWPRQEGTNGRILEWKVSITLRESPDNLIKILETNYTGDATPKRISIPSEYQGKIKKIEFYISEGLADVVSIQEIEFFNYPPIIDIPPVFTDNSCSELITGISRSEIEKISNSVYRNIALALYDGTYDPGRTSIYHSYPLPEIQAMENKTSTYGLLDNVTGIYIEKDQYLIIMASGIESPVTVRIMDHDIEGSEGWEGQNVIIEEGVNKIKAEYTGLVYILYHASEDRAVRINFASGTINGYWDINKPDQDWNKLLNNASASRVDMLGDYSHLIFSTEELKTYTANPDRLIEVYDSIVLLEEEFMGLYKYSRTNKNRMLFRCTPSATYMHATSYRTEYNPSTMAKLCNAEGVRTDDIWGPAHEVGHVNQTRPGFRWKNSDGNSVLGEVSNNVYTMHVQRVFGNSSRLEVNNTYEAAYNTFMVQKIKHMEAIGLVDKKYFFEQLVHFWQLELYFSDVLGQADFYKDIHEQIRILPDPEPAKEHHAFAFHASKISGYDLTEFFSRYGYDLDQQATDNISSLGLPTPEQPFWYIRDSNVDLFRNNTPVQAGTAIMSGSNGSYYFLLNGWTGVVAFEVKVDGEIRYISTSKSFTLALPEGIITVDAIGADGSVVPVEF